MGSTAFYSGIDDRVRAAETSLGRLWWGHCISCAVQTINTVLLSIFTPRDAAFYVDLFTYYNPFPRLENQPPTSAGSFQAAVHWLPAIFTLLAALHHAIAAGRWASYSAYVITGRGWLAWAEYSLSAPVMNVAIACICGTSQFCEIILIATATATTMFFGLFAEEFAHKSDLTYAWIAAALGCVPFAGAWAALAVVYSQSARGAPAFVHAIFIGMALLETLFAVNLTVFLSRQTTDRPASSRAAIANEWGKIVLSLTAKTFLAWLVYGGLRK